MTTRCKYKCDSVLKTYSSYDQKFLYEASFSPVTGGSEENKKFFQYTPSGILKIGTYKEDVFSPGKSYYLDVTEAE